MIFVLHGPGTKPTVNVCDPSGPSGCTALKTDINPEVQMTALAQEHFSKPSSVNTVHSQMQVKQLPCKE